MSMTLSVLSIRNMGLVVFQNMLTSFLLAAAILPDPKRNRSKTSLSPKFRSKHLIFTFAFLRNKTESPSEVLFTHGHALTKMALCVGGGRNPPNERQDVGHFPQPFFPLPLLPYLYGNVPLSLEREEEVSSFIAPQKNVETSLVFPFAALTTFDFFLLFLRICHASAKAEAAFILGLRQSMRGNIIITFTLFFLLPPPPVVGCCT